MRVTTSYGEDGKTREYPDTETGLSVEIALAGPAILARLILHLYRADDLGEKEIADILGVADVLIEYE